ncbi:MAG: response regulator [Fusobacteriota bacterium]
MRILIAEDNHISAMIIEKFLSEHGDCDVAYNGKEAVDLYKKSLEENEYYDLVILDIMMPIMNGQKALKKIREIEKNVDHKSTIVMLTALDDNKNIKEALEYGCDSYFNKPIKKEKILTAIRRLGLID